MSEKNGCLAKVTRVQNRSVSVVVVVMVDAGYGSDINAVYDGAG